MPSCPALGCLPSVKKQKHNFYFFSVRVISLEEPFALADNLYIDLDIGLIILDITKASSNNNCATQKMNICRFL